MAKGLPWFIIDLANLTLITTTTIPEDIDDTKQIGLSEEAVPGLDYEPIVPGGFGNRTIKFNIPLVNRTTPLGTTLIKKQLEQLRHQIQPFALGLAIGNLPAQGPKVLYFWGTNNIPQEYFVKKVDFKEKSSLVNDFGISQFTVASIELKLDQETFLYKAEELFRQVSAQAGTVANVISVTQSILRVKPF